MTRVRAERGRVPSRAELQIQLPLFDQHDHVYSIVQAVAIRSRIILIRFLFDSVPTRSCLGTWQTMLSSPLLVTWKSNPLALGPRLNALLHKTWSFEY